MSALANTYAQFPSEFVRGEGVYLFDASGRKYLDLYGGHAVCILGHSPEKVISAVSSQAEQ